MKTHKYLLLLVNRQTGQKFTRNVSSYESITKFTSSLRVQIINSYAEIKRIIEV